MNTEIAILLLGIFIIVISVYKLLSSKQFTDNPDDYEIIEVPTAFTKWYVVLFKGKPILPKNKRFLPYKRNAELLRDEIILKASVKKANKVLFND